MDYKITKVVNRLEGARNRPIKLELEVVEDLDAGSDFCAIINRENELYVRNKHYMVTKKSDPLLLNVEDISALESIVKHMEEISPRFIGTYHSGHSWSGYLGTFYYFPDGKQEYHKKGAIPAGYESVMGKSLDDMFESKGCEYILGMPHMQHYRHGRFDFYLKKNELGIETDTSHQIFEGKHPKYILELLNFIKANPHRLLEKMIKGGMK